MLSQRVAFCCLSHQRAEKQPATLYVAAVESEHPPVQMGLRLPRTDGTLSHAQQPRLHEGKHAVYSGENFVCGQAGGLDGGARAFVTPRVAAG